MRKTHFVFITFVSLVSFVTPVNTYCQFTSLKSPEIQQREADLVHFGDLIDVDFAGGTDYDWRGTLTQEGKLDGLDQFSPVHGLCRSEVEIAQDVAKNYGKILRDPKITVRIIDRSNRAVALLEGAVRTPMRFRFQRPAHLRELIVAAGGLTDDASGAIVIYRPPNLNCLDRSAVSGSGNGTQTINITINDLLNGKESANIVVLSGDIIRIERAFPIYITGAVNNPRPIYTHSGMTLSRAIATAGGLAKGAAGPKVKVFRRNGTDSTVIQADLEKIKNGEIKDVDLTAFDIIEVEFKGRTQRKYPPIIVGENKGRNLSDPPLRIIE